MGPIQLGLPVLSALPKDWKSIILDIKDCFFSIPLHPDDIEKFAFTVPSINHGQPDARYEWKVLPQGMANSPTICQIYVNSALIPIRNKYPDIIIYHYMDDVLICHPEQTILDKVFTDLISHLKTRGLIIAPEKIQRQQVQEFLGAKINSTIITPLKTSLRLDHLNTLNDFQRLLGDINWIRPYLRLTTQDLGPLFNILKGDAHPSSPRKLTEEARKTLDVVQKRLDEAQVDRIDLSASLSLIVLPNNLVPTGVLWQQGPLMWIHLPYSPGKTIVSYPEAMAQIIFKALKSAIIVVEKLQTR